MMAKMGNEFPYSPRVHADWEFTLVEKSTKAVKNTKKFRLVAIHLVDENRIHIAIVIPELSNEYVQLSDLVRKFLSQIEHDTVSGMSGLAFTGNVFLYTDKLLVAEEPVKRHFEKDRMTLHLRVEKQNLLL
jgi:hypothetical protein